MDPEGPAANDRPATPNDVIFSDMRTDPRTLRRSARDALRQHSLTLVIIAVVVPALLTAWSLASPLGSSPDDSFHLPSIWCAAGEEPGRCEISDDGTEAIVPGLVVAGSWCYSPLSDVSARCQDQYEGQVITTSTWNWNGLYPPVYYRTMSLFVVDNPRTGVLLMRAFNAMLAVLLLAAIALLAPRSIRQAAFVTSVSATVPLGLFLLASNNPSGWAVLGVGTYWAFLLTALETKSRRAMLAAYGFTGLAAVIAIGSRADAAAYILLSTLAVIALTLRTPPGHRKAVRNPRLIPLVVVGIAGVVAFARSAQAGVAAGGFAGGETLESAGTIDYARRIADLVVGIDPNRLAEYLMYVPGFTAGAFGGWGLGWLDTPMPAIVVWISFPVAFALVLIGLGALYRGKAIAVAGLLSGVLGVPTWIAVSGGHEPGTYLQPRYVYPLMLVLVGVALVRANRDSTLTLSRAQWLSIAITLAIAQSAALHATIRRFATGNDVRVFDLNVGVEWWRQSAPAPMTVWAIGTLAYLSLVLLAFRSFDRAPSATSAEGDPVSSGR